MRRVARVVLAPALVVAAAALLFHRALAGSDLAVVTVAAIVAGAAAGSTAALRRAPWPVPLAATLAVVLGGAALVAGRAPSAHLVPDAFAVFLTVGLPAGGLAEALVVPFVVLALAMAASVVASVKGRTLVGLAGPVLAVGVISLLVAPVGFAWWVPLVIAVACGGILVADARNDVTQLPALVGTNTESRRQVVWWRPIVQVGPALLAVVLLAAVMPKGRTFDARHYVHPSSETIADANPLAVAARSPLLATDHPVPLASVAVDGPSPGRLRLAVLDRYAATGWHQAAQFSITGETLAADPVYTGQTAPAGDRLAPAQSTVVVRPSASPSPFHAVPSAGEPQTVEEPARVRYSPAAGILVADGPTDGLRYRTSSAPIAAAAVAGDVTVSTFPPALAECPRSGVIAAVSQQLTSGAVATDDRLGRIENFLKVRRVYDAAAPGGQTLRSVERFLEQDYGRGNLEVFVTSYALLARCAGVPVRVVVGLPAAATGTTAYTRRDVTAWVETPLRRAGWVAHDPLPTPAEQLQQAQLAQLPPPTTPPTSAPSAAPAREVTPHEVRRPGPSWPALALVLLLALLVLVALAWALLVPAVVVRRRRRTAAAADAVHAAWATVTDALVDRHLPLEPHHTPDDVVRVVSGRVPVSVPRLLQGLAPLVNRARYSGVETSAADAGLAWGFASAVADRLPVTRDVRLAPLRHPVRAFDRLKSTFGVARRRERWHGDLPPSAVVSSAEAPRDIPDVTIDARIGEGSTGTVYRGHLAPGNVPVAVKVFRYGPGDAGFDEHRFDWEVRVARTVSGLPHLPTVHDAGITPVTHRPFLVSSLYERGTLLDRVRRGGPMTQAEVVAIGTDLATALVTLHQMGVVHADVKPENVFSGQEGWVLGDLGSAWLRASRGPAATLTPPYAAPEVWRGAAPTPVADLYSLALTMLFAVTGQVPLASVPPTGDDVAAAFPDHPVMVRALEPDARRRPRSVADFVRQLHPNTVLFGPPGGLRSLSLPTPTVSHQRR